MILHEKDWDKYPNAIIHNSTNNESFIRLSYVFKRRGIKNHLFLLALHDPSLEFVDPHSRELTMVQILAVAKETRENYWYYLREVVRVDDSGTGESTYFKANRANIAQAWCFWDYVNTLTILIRQKGKSLMHDVLYTNILNITGQGSRIQLLTKDSTLRGVNVDRLKDLYTKLPSIFQTAKKKDKQNIEIIENTNLNNTMQITLAQKSKLAAVNVGRGPTITVHGGDEVAYDYNIDISLPVMLAAGTTAKKNARARGKPAGTCLYTTVGYLDTTSGKFIHKLYSGGLQWSDEFYDIPSREELHMLLKKNCVGIMDIMVIEFNHTGLGMSDEELADDIRATGSTGVQAEVEFLNKWAKGSSSSVLSRKLINVLSKSKEEPMSTEISPNGFILRWYVDKEEYLNKDIVFGLDLSEMIGSDSGSLFGIDPITGETVVCGDYNTANINDFGEFIYWFLKRYRKSVLIGERKSVMLAVFDQIANLFGDSENIFKRVFNLSVDDRSIYNLTSDRRTSTLDAYNMSRKGFGYMTSGSGSQSRQALFNKLIPSIELLGCQMKDKLLISQVTKLEEKNNRIDHTSNEHDDMVIAYLLVQWFLTTAKNLEYYGLNKETILTVVNSGANSDLVNERIEAAKNEETIREINSILGLMETEENHVIRLRLAMKLKLLRKDITELSGKTLNIEGRLEIIAKKYSNER